MSTQPGSTDKRALADSKNANSNSTYETRYTAYNLPASAVNSTRGAQSVCMYVCMYVT